VVHGSVLANDADAAPERRSPRPQRSLAAQRSGRKAGVLQQSSLVLRPERAGHVRVTASHAW
jgi:hypothetical protein